MESAGLIEAAINATSTQRHTMRGMEMLGLFWNKCHHSDLDISQKLVEAHHPLKPSRDLG